jgi:hypothetical protein
MRSSNIAEGNMERIVSSKIGVKSKSLEFVGPNVLSESWAEEELRDIVEIRLRRERSNNIRKELKDLSIHSTCPHQFSSSLSIVLDKVIVILQGWRGTELKAG